ncbi:hypothetical protein KDW_39470 [Dictyobacter vulcani]|uniref:HTH cro/C1-type domain-containing protein n=1 Tax=Dictyobacter vulcani TaxID=2607529 RepID=A0A5J4KPI1_9CHLR|nr:helix-turn-helix transcriptional regulator [Dictyobacter vulcani]GER89785.1 hypothetical protein KDW_39470 [Dictyobacter vulcani]
MRGRRERELESLSQSEGSLGATIRSWRRYREMTVTELAIRAGFGKNGRGYISKIEHQHIKHLGEDALVAIAHALDLVQEDLQQSRLPAPRESYAPGKEALDHAIAGCKAWLKVYQQDDMLLDRARMHLKLAELYWERRKRAEQQDERDTLLESALASIEQVLPVFREKAPDSYQEAQGLHTLIEREQYRKELDDAIAGCKALLSISHQEERPLDWARTHARLAQLYRDRASHAEQAEERPGWLEKALQSIDQALPLFRGHAPVSYTQAQHMRGEVIAAREETLRSPF